LVNQCVVMLDVTDGAGQVDDVPNDDLARMTIVITLATVLLRQAEDGSVASEFGHGLFRAVVVNQRFASGGGGNQRRGGGVVEHARQSKAGFV
jgi:hypothetical protein